MSILSFICSIIHIKANKKKSHSKNHVDLSPSSSVAATSMMDGESSTEVETVNDDGGEPKEQETPRSASSGSKHEEEDGHEDVSGTVVEEGEEDAAVVSSNSKKKRNRKSAGTAGAYNKTYSQLVEEAIVDMSPVNRNGSSLVSIKKWIAVHYPELDTASPHFNGRVNGAIKTGLKSKPPKFAKVKASFKIAKEFKEAARAKKRKVAAAAAAKKKKAQADSNANIKQQQLELIAAEKEQRNKEADTTNKLKQMSPEEAEAARKAKEEAATRKAAAEAKAKQIADRLRRRRFPIEDTKLHAEDKELGVKPPADVQPRPYLPYFWHVTLPLHHPGRLGKTSGPVLAASKVDGLESDSRGLVPDLLQVYHFFRGDVHFTLDDDNNNTEDEISIVPAFSLKQLIYCVEQVLNGNTKKSKLVPPLLVHLFVKSLQILLQMPSDSVTLTKDERKLRKDFTTYLFPALSMASWADVTYLYMDAMERFYLTDASRDPNVLQPLPADVDYLFGRTDETFLTVPLTPGSTINTVEELEPQHYPLPAAYSGYLGDPRSALSRAHSKLARQDPWLLSAEELLALLRALTEDILATHPAASQDMAKREDEMFELLKEKRAADLKLRKVRLGFEGPKKPSRPKPKAGGEGKDGDEENGKTVVEDSETNDEKSEEKPFKPTATRKQFDAAQKAQERADDAYEKGIRKLVARTEPVGYDRNHNAVYCFLYDPDVVYVEDKKLPASSNTSSNLPVEMQFNRCSWHVVETTSLFDQFIGSLDIRGRREHDLYEALVGPPGTQQSLRRFLYDDVKEQADARCKIKEKESLRERLEIARIKCDEEKGRRSGRLAGQAEIELTQIQAEIDDLEREATGKKALEGFRDYEDLTGLLVLKQFEMAGRVETRRTREKKAVAQARKLPLMLCTKLCSTGNIDGTGLVGILVSSLLELEEHCESLAPWERKDITRSTWVSRLEGAVLAWNSISPDILGSPELISRSSLAPSDISSVPLNTNTANASRQVKRDYIDDIDESSLSKRRKHESPAVSTLPSPIAAHSVSSIIAFLRQPLLDLEERVADLTNVALATRDADLADDNMSTDSSGEDQASKESLENAWKKLIHKMRQTPAKKHGQVRELLVSAIKAARQAHVPSVVTQLRAALLQYHPKSASDCKVAAIKVLEAHGDLEEDEDDECDDDGEGNEEPREEAAPSVLSAEGAILRSSLGGSEDASREDWVGMVKSVKTMSRLASLTCAFIRDAMAEIEKLKIKRDELISALQAWGKEEERQTKVRDGKKKALAGAPKDIIEPSEVWADVRCTDEIYMAKAEGYPWWPAKKCEVKDPVLARSMSQLNRSLVAFVGEMGGLRVVNTGNLTPFTGLLVDEKLEVEFPRDIRTQLDDCMAMARRIQRGLLKKGY